MRAMQVERVSRGSAAGGSFVGVAAGVVAGVGVGVQQDPPPQQEDSPRLSW
jgi:hypothetical protein